jgi:sugar O-acyltransferase (sialic acid O-acetyltransferase NeuD family)
MNKLKYVYLIGAGGFSKQVIDSYLSYNVKIIGIFDDFRTGPFYRNIPIIGKLNTMNKNIKPKENVFVTIGDNNIRKKIISDILHKFSFPNCFRPNADIPSTLNIGQGNYIGSFSKLGEDSHIGNFNFINECTILAHDTKIGDYNHLSPNVSMGGNAIIGNTNMIGTSAIIIPKIIIGNDNIIGAGSVIIRNIDCKSKLVGNPAKKIN